MNSSGVQRLLDIQQGHAVAVLERVTDLGGITGQDIQLVVVVVGISTRRFHKLQALGRSLWGARSRAGGADQR